MTLSSDLRRIADWLNSDLTLRDEPIVHTIRQAADALETKAATRLAEAYVAERDASEGVAMAFNVGVGEAAANDAYRKVRDELDAAESAYRALPPSPERTRE